MPAPRTTLLVLSVAAVVIPALGFGGGPTRPSGFGATPRNPASSAPTPSPSASPVPGSSALTGIGPFVIFGRRGPEAVDVFAVDVGAPAEKRRTIFLGRAESWPSHGGPDRGGARVAALPFGDGTVYLLARGDRFGTRAIRTNRLVASVAVSPDGRRVAVASMTQDGVAEAEVVVYSTRNPASRKSIFRRRTGADQQGGALRLFWSSPEELTLIDVCHCDGGPGYAKTYRISIGGNVYPLEFLDDHIAYDPGVQRDTARFVFDDVPPVDCTESESACDDILHTLAVADASTGSLRAVASRPNEPFVWPVVSPDGDWVAYTRYGSSEIFIHSLRVRSFPARVWYSAADLQPLMWLDHQRLLVLATAPDFVGDRTTGRLLLIAANGDGWGEPATLASTVDLEYLGWLA